MYFLLKYLLKYFKKQLTNLEGKSIQIKEYLFHKKIKSINLCLIKEDFIMY